MNESERKGFRNGHYEFRFILVFEKIYINFRKSIQHLGFFRLWKQEEIIARPQIGLFDIYVYITQPLIVYPFVD